MSTPEEEALSYEHEHATYAAAPPAVNENGDAVNPPSGPSVEQTRGVPVDEDAGGGTQSRSRAKKDE